MSPSDIKINFNILIIINLKYLQDTHKARLFCSIQYKNGCLLPFSYFFFLYRFSFTTIHESLTPHYHGASFTAKLGLVFVLTLENAFSQMFHFKANRKNISFSKKSVIGIFTIAFRSRSRHIFMLMNYLVLFSFILSIIMVWSFPRFPVILLD